MATLVVPDPECELDHVPGKAGTDVNLKTVMSNSIAFNGINVVLNVRK